ncbi:MAG TPA: polysaccharide deacetylase family protein [Clostridiaceae bacterium]|nr:polysaccharide deacetylase family protein [Clostridiaceae bacterium]
MKKTMLILCFLFVWSLSSSCSYVFDMLRPTQSVVPTEVLTSVLPPETTASPSITVTETAVTTTIATTVTVPTTVAPATTPTTLPAATTVPATQAATTAREVYRVRRSADDAASQIGAYFELENAIRMADSEPGYHVFDSRGQLVHEGTASGTTVATQTTAPTAAPDAFAALDNTDLSFWYQRGYGGAQPSIDAGYASLFAAYPSYWLRAGNPDTIYLTFDCGYEYNNNTNRILDLLSAQGVKASFFVTGSFIRSNPATVTRMMNEGHLVGNHTDRHLRPAAALAEGLQVFQQDIRGAEQAMLSNTGYAFDPFFRPPEGGFSERSLAVANAEGYTNVFWSFGYRDWETDAQIAPADALAIIKDQLHGGAILLLHAVSDTNVVILPDLIAEIQGRGYVLRRLDS